VLTGGLENIKFKNYPAERLRIDSISSRLTGAERLLRLYLLEQIIESGAPVNIISLKRTAALRQLDTDTLIKSMVDKRVIVPDQAGNINFAYPVSALPTNHRVTLKDGRQFCAMCAVDAMGAAFTLKQDVAIDSICAHCSEKITVVIQDERITELNPASAHVLHVDLNQTDNWAGSC
jgi:hypothetical protein